jgi:hypothetical protein
MTEVNAHTEWMLNIDLLDFDFKPFITLLLLLPCVLLILCATLFTLRLAVFQDRKGGRMDDRKWRHPTQNDHVFLLSVIRSKIFMNAVRDRRFELEIHLHAYANA